MKSPNIYLDNAKPSKFSSDVFVLAVESASVGVWNYDLTTGKRTWSKEMLSIFGLPEDVEPEIRTLMSQVHPDDYDRVVESMERSIETQDDYDIEYRIIRADNGETVWGRFIGRTEYDETGKPIRMLGAGYDITRIKKAEIRAELAEQRALQASRSKSEFLANMSHEIRTPMNGIMGMGEILSNSGLSSHQIDMVNVVNRSGNALLTIINDILDFSKAESGRIELELLPFNLRDCIEDVTALLASTISDTGLDLLLRIQPDLPQTFIGDAGRVRQILTNIVGNAVKFTDTGHILIDVSAELIAETAHLKIQIIDTGIGIAQDKLEHIFEQFSQADGSTTRKYGGTGLGLSISKQLTELMDGKIIVTSQLGEGTNFCITLPLPVAKRKETETKGKDLDIAGSIVLIIDDNAVNRSILTEQLKYWQCKTVAVSSSKLGLTILQKAYDRNIRIDVVIVDYQMPEENGEDFYHAMQQQSEIADIPVIMLSSVDAVELRDRMNSLNISSFLTKPAKSSILKNAIDQALHGLVETILSTKSNPDEKRPILPCLVSDQHSQIDVLIAEDNEVNQIYIGHVMQDLGLSYEIVQNGRVAIEKWELLSPKIILMDISMPDMNGYEASQTIRAIEKNNSLTPTPIIAVTAHSMKGDEEVCLQHGMDEYLSKPISISILKRCFKKWGVVSKVKIKK